MVVSMKDRAWFRLSTVAIGLLVWTIAQPPRAAAFSPAGWVMQVKLRQSFTVPAGTKVPRFLESSGRVPSDAFTSLSTIHRGVIYVSAGSLPTTCQIGIAGGVVTSPPITVPANTTVPVFLEDTGGSSTQPGSDENLIGIVVTAGSGGPVTVQPGSNFTFTIIPTENAVY